jgi:ubiquinone/menaquinone biosynthesis C-methylase UbiE
MSEVPSTTAKIAKQYDDFAPRYDSGMRLFERVFVGDGRRWVCAKARGDVLEIAIGTGRNLPYYDRSVRVTGIDISLAMLEIARERAREDGMEADLHVGDAQQLNFPDGTFDSVVSTASMCTIPDYRAAIGEAWRVLRPGGQFLLLEHVRSPNRAVRAVQRLLDPLSVRLMCDHLLREPADVLRDTGFRIGRLERSKLGIIERVQAWKPT